MRDCPEILVMQNLVFYFKKSKSYWFQIPCIRVIITAWYLKIPDLPPSPVVFPKLFSRERLKPLDFFWYFLVSKQTSDVSMQHDVSVFFASTILNRLFTSCIKLYWYWINTSSNMNGWLSNWPSLPPQKKLCSKSSALLGLVNYPGEHLV